MKCGNVGIQPAKSAYAAMEFNRMPATMYVTSTFGLIAGLLHQKGIPPYGLVNSPGFMAVISMLNFVILDIEIDHGKDLPFGAKTHESTERTARMESLEAELNDTRNCPSLGPTKKKRQVLKKCREVSSALDGVSEK